jgi:type III pantothenate kinase
MWLAISIGNSRQHWGWFHGNELLLTVDHPPDYWDEEVLEKAESIVIASVVPDALERWSSVAKAQTLTLDKVPIKGGYEGLGVDRALNILGASYRYGYPTLVVDFGTAITISATNNSGRFIGGCIMPGFSLQFKALQEHTALLPPVELPDVLPPAMALTTEQSMQSGVIQVTLAGIEQFCLAWRQRQPQGRVIATGGDSTFVYEWLPHLFNVQDSYVGLWGMYASIMGLVKH